MGRPKTTPQENQCMRCGTRFLTGGRGRPPRTRRFCSLSCANLAQRRSGSFTAPPARLLSQVEAAWLAGVVDGEGSVTFIERSRKGTTIRLSVCNTHLPFLQRIQAVAGTGAIIVQRGLNPARPAHAPSWIWGCYSRNAQALLRQMRPWLVVKVEKADRALALHIP